MSCLVWLVWLASYLLLPLGCACLLPSLMQPCESWHMLVAACCCWFVQPIGALAGATRVLQRMLLLVRHDVARCSALLAMVPSALCSALAPWLLLFRRCCWLLLLCAADACLADRRASAAAAPCCAALTAFREACRAAAGVLLVTCCTAVHTGCNRTMLCLCDHNIVTAIHRLAPAPAPAPAQPVRNHVAAAPCTCLHAAATHSRL